MPQSAAEAVLDHLTNDPTMRLLPPLAQLAWLKLAAAMHKAGLSVLRLGSSRVLVGSEVAAFAGLAAAEWEAHAPTLIEFGLLLVEADGAVACPALDGPKPRVTSERRAAASRMNGGKGGRPRKAPNPAQREIMLPISGSQVVSRQKAEVNSSGFQVSPAIAKANHEIKILETKLAVSNADMQRVGHAAAAAAGLQGQGHFGAVRQWLAAGASEELILNTIETSMQLGRRPGHLGYFTKAIQEALGRQPATPTPMTGQTPASSPSPKAFQAWSQAYEEWCFSGKHGPLPKATWFADDGSRVAA